MDFYVDKTALERHLPLLRGRFVRGNVHNIQLNGLREKKIWRNPQKTRGFLCALQIAGAVQLW